MLKTNNSELRSKVKLLTSIPAVGELTALYLLSFLPEFQSANHKELAALAGIAPMNRDSGGFKGKRYIQGI